MTPIGHFACAAAVASQIDVLSRRETFGCFLYYAFFLVVFAVSTLFAQPGTWAMYLHDQFGNLALLVALIWGWRGDVRQKAFICILIGSQILAAYTHLFDRIALSLLGAIPEGMWRPHNILHTPLVAVVISLGASPLIRWLFKTSSLRATFWFLLLGYLLHVVMDSMTYRYQIYYLWPFASVSGSLASVFQQPDALSRWLGNPLYQFSPPSAENIDGFIVYQAEVAINLLLMALVGIRVVSNRFLQGIAKVESHA